MARRITTLALCTLLALAAAGLGAQTKIPRADTVVKPKVYLSQQPVARGTSFEVAVVAEIMRGFHINANKVLEDYLIPTVVEPELPAGLRLVGTAYPKGELQKFEFSEKEMNVYDGKITIRLKLEVAKDALLGTMKLPLVLRYQACNDKLCLPPVKLPLTIELDVAPAGSRSTSLHPAIFTQK